MKIDFLNSQVRTENTDYETISRRLKDSDIIRLLHSSIGMVTESAEFADVLKKHIFYGKEVDKVNLIEELGDILYYVAMACNALDTDFETVMERNIAKLKARYPDKFTEELAENRDLEKERQILESGSEVDVIEISIPEGQLLDANGFADYINLHHNGYSVMKIDRSILTAELKVVLIKKRE